ncbi:MULTISPECIES: peptidoglycan-binding protein [unclassified Streptomyces]|uniref:peptidoglycan-binding domain-containing protein n=1 Tax=unclassified Streptomyces TaxID=2593676 RepID=UPI00068FDE68|nr:MULTISPECIES: peptidoglycan-binding domain-containing protein [unclassified Streptomyces]MCH0557496.1 peptidoglycan-binding protein [Streptomyces sp. MUM 16J]
MRKKLAAATTGLLLITGLGVGSATSASAVTRGNYCGIYTLAEPEVSYGDRGDAVKAVQCALNRSVRGVNLAEDGIFGGLTYNAVVKFQGCAGLAKDGIVGPKTWRQLDNWSDWDTKAFWIC